MQPLYTAGAGLILAVALASLSAGISILIKIGNPKKIHAILYFVISVPLFIFFAILWQSALIQSNQTAPSPITPQEVNDMWPLWLSAIGTIALALITFTISIVLPWLKKPKFEIEFDNKEPFCSEAATLVTAPAETQAQISTLPAYWIRLKIKNAGKSVAKRCVAKLTKVMDDSGKELTNYDPVILHWVGTDWNDVPFRPIDLNQDEYEFLDMLVSRSDYAKKIKICTDTYARGTPKYLSPGTHIIQITIYGDGVIPCSKRYRVIWGALHYRDVKIEEMKN